MKVTVFSDTDTLYIEFKPGPVAETRDLDENTLLDLDDTVRICAITVEHATERTGIPTFCLTPRGAPSSCDAGAGRSQPRAFSSGLRRV